MSILIRPADAADIAEAFRWYERQRLGLGDEFLAVVQFALENIEANPTLYSVVHRETRRLLLRRFPYGIFYRVYGECIVVVARMHGRRNSKRWKSLR
ncbi:MAG TPA: type II toxin-antitoxin system RelE/ParE family toxin [Terriglobia bacterium]|nr:type II toxin-antitoxin system RelE/ParE family toxin [Terriglobia bacterium]